MIETLHMEYIRSLNCNYERILLGKRPEERRYQYCILTRGEVRGLLPGSLRYIDGMSYLYYEISSRQNISHLYAERCITREWLIDFLWSLKQIQQELKRFLLDIRNILWYPEQVFQDLESNVFSFVYVPYFEGESGFLELMEFWVEHIDYSDEELVECVYRMYERVERNGEVYLESRIFEDAECLENKEETAENIDSADVLPEMIQTEGIAGTEDLEATEEKLQLTEETQRTTSKEKRGIRGIWGGRKKRDKKLREEYQQSMEQIMTGYAVAEEISYTDEVYGRTLYIEKSAETGERVHRLCTPEGKLLGSLEQAVFSVGKRKEEVDLALQDTSVSRLHARITNEEGGTYLEDLNSTNGTFRNNRRLRPYEKQRLDEGDEIRFGNVVLIFR